MLRPSSLRPSLCCDRVFKESLFYSKTCLHCLLVFLYLFSDSRAELEEATDSYVPEGVAPETEPAPESQSALPSTSAPKPTSRNSVCFKLLI